MKKLFTVLAVLLVASVAFAAVISGSVSAEYAFDFDKKTITYGKPGVGSLDATLNFDPTEAIIIGDADATHIEAKVVAGADLMINKGNNHDDGYEPFKKGTDYFWYASKTFDKGTTETTDDTTLWAAITFKVSTFKIVAKNWSVDFINGLGLDFAKSAIDSETFHEDTAEENTQYYSIDNSLKKNHNVTVAAYGYQFGFGLSSSDWTDKVTFALSAKTPEYEFSGVKLQAGVGYEVKDLNWRIAGSAKVAYATDKLSVSAAYDAVKELNKDFIDNELAVKFDFAPVAVDVYFANENATTEDSFKKYFPETEGLIIPLASNYLSAKVVVDVAKVAENVPVKVTLTGKNLINEEKQNISVAAETTIVPNFKFGAYFKDWFDYASNHRKLGGTVEFTGVQNLTLNAEVAYAFAKEDGDKEFFGLVGAKYAHELFTASAEIGMEKVYNQDARFGADAKVTSTKLVDGAELSAKALFNLNNLHDTIDVKAENSLTLACKVTF